MGSSTVQHIVFDATDPQRVAGFWSQALGRPVENDWGDFVRLAADDAGTRIAFSVVPEAKRVKNRVHLDLSTDGREDAVTELVELGASVVETRSAGGHTWTVMTDPEGNVFCVA